MKTKFLFLIGLSTLLFQCSTEEDVTKKSPLWGVEFSEESTATFVQGALEQQNAGPKVIVYCECRCASSNGGRRCVHHFFCIRKW